MLTSDERLRYNRQILIPEINEQGQARLKNASIFIAGAGGLGSSIAIYCAAAGMGTIRIADHDRVELHNLNRQVLHGEPDIGSAKVASAVRKLRSLNTDITVEGIDETITPETIARLARGCDLIVDAVDSLDTRFVLNNYCITEGIPFFHGAVSGFDGRVMTVVPGTSACFACLYRNPAPAATTPVIGVTPGVIGCIQATEVIKYISGAGVLLCNKLLLYDGLEMTFTTVTIKKNPACPSCGTKTGSNQ